MEALAEAERAVEKCLSAAIFAFSDNDTVECLDRLQTLSQRLAALHMSLVREVDARGIAARDRASSTAAWLRERWRVSPGAASRLVKLAAVVAAELPATQAALVAGRVNVEQTQVIGSAIAALPVEHRPAGEQYLLEQAGIFGPRELGRLGERLFEVVAPQAAEERTLAELTRSEERAFRDRALWFSEIPGTSRTRLSGWLGREDAATVRAALDPLCAPADADVDGGRDERAPGQRRADALVQVCRMVMAGGELPDNGGDRPQVVVTIPYAALRQQIAAGMLNTDLPRADREASANQPGRAVSPPAIQRPAVAVPAVGGSGKVREAGVGVLDDGSQLTAAAVRRLACDAGILPVVLGSAGQVLDVGRQRRLFTGALRRALVVRDRGCAHPGCDRPAPWCDGHHIVHWPTAAPPTSTTRSCSADITIA